jgi:DNA-binding GntR family transcriptional regulator
LRYEVWTAHSRFVGPNLPSRTFSLLSCGCSATQIYDATSSGDRAARNGAIYYDEHKAVVGALLRRDAEAAASAMHTDLDAVSRNLFSSDAR